MARPCIICTHPDHRAIDRQLLEGLSAATVAREFNASSEAMRRHNRNHVKPVARLTSQIAKVAVPTAQQVEETMALVPQAIDLQRTLAEAVADTRRLQQEMELDGDKRVALAALETLRKHLETAQKMSGLSGRDTGTSITTDQVHNEVRSLLSDFQGAPEDARQWAAKNLLADLPTEGTDDAGE